MELWNRVCHTNPSITRRVDIRGGFTTIDAQEQLKTATMEWGPYGMKWGLKDCVFSPIIDFDMVKKERVIVEMAMDAVFYYPGGEFPISTDIAYRPGNDSRKKLMTAATTKALSKLGFNSDVFEGKFDDNQYVAEMNRKFNNPVPLQSNPVQRPPQQYNIPGVRR
jgi:hypothetical protein